MANSAQIGILMPVKNAAPWIEDCIRSMLEQSYSSWNLYAVDDHGTDESFALLSRFTATTERVKVFKNEGNGIIDALKMAYSNSSEPFITRMDADDIMPIHKLETLYKASVNDVNAVVTGKVKYFSEHAVSEGYLRYEAWLNERIEQEDFEQHMYRECVVASANWMCHRDTLDRVNAFNTSVYPEDYDLVLRWYAEGIKMKGVHSTTHLWREHEKRTSRNSERYAQESFFKLKVKRWIELELEEKSRVVLFGEGLKTNLTKKILASCNIGYLQVVQEPSKNQQSPESYQAEAIDKVLICVYPQADKRKALENILIEKGLMPLTNWWYV